MICLFFGFWWRLNNYIFSLNYKIIIGIGKGVEILYKKIYYLNIVEVRFWN